MMCSPKLIIALLSVAFIATHAADFPTNQSGAITGSINGERGVVIMSVQKGIPVVVTERKSFDSDPYFPQNWVDAPKITQEMIVAWQTNYEVFSKALISGAENAGLDSLSLAKILQIVRSAQQNTNLVVLPIGAHSAIWNGEPVWIVGLRWEIGKIAVEDGYLGHGRYFIFTSKTLKLVRFATCG